MEELKLSHALKIGRLGGEEAEKKEIGNAFWVGE